MSPEEFNRNFDVALEGGKEWENMLRDLLASGEVECKRDYRAHETGNVFVEVECRGNASGLSTTEAEWWVFGVCNAAGDIETFLAASVPWLFVKRKEWTQLKKWIAGGEKDDAGQQVSKGFLVRVADFANK